MCENMLHSHHCVCTIGRNAQESEGEREKINTHKITSQNITEQK